MRGRQRETVSPVVESLTTKRKAKWRTLRFGDVVRIGDLVAPCYGVPYKPSRWGRVTRTGAWAGYVGWLVMRDEQNDFRRKVR